MYDLVQNMGQIPPCDSFKQGHQNDGSGHLWCVIANTPHGQIPAKVRDRHIFEGSFYAAEKSFSSKNIFQSIFLYYDDFPFIKALSIYFVPQWCFVPSLETFLKNVYQSTNKAIRRFQFSLHQSFLQIYCI